MKNLKQNIALPFCALLLCFLTAGFCTVGICKISAAASAVSNDSADSDHSTTFNSSVTINSSTVSASGKQLSVSFRFGFDKCIKFGRNMHIYAVVTNNGSDFTGTIGVLEEYDSSDYSLYETACVLAAGETKVIEFSAPSPQNNWPILLIKDENEKTELTKSFRVTMTDDNTVIFTGVLTEEPDSMSYLSTVGTSKYFFFDETNFPSLAEGLDSLDILFISNFNTSLLNQKQIDAILEWTKQGGSLFFGTGPTATKTISAFENSLFVGTVGDTERRSTKLGMSEEQFRVLKQELYLDVQTQLDVEAMQEQHSEAVDFVEDTVETTEENIETSDPRLSEIDAFQLQSMPKDMVALSLDNFTPLLSEKDGFALILKQNYENGIVLVASFELGMEEEYKNMGIQLYRIAKNNFSSVKKEQLNTSTYSSFPYTLSSILNEKNGKGFPHLQVFFLLLAAYAILAGPILYFVLKKLDKRHFIWLFMPAAGLLCTAIIYVIGTPTRITEPFIQYLSSLSIDQTTENTAVDHTVYFSVTAPYNRKYSVPLSNVSNVEIVSDRYNGYTYYDNEPSSKDSAFYTTGIYHNGTNESTLIMNDYSAFRPAIFSCSTQENALSESSRFDTELALDKEYSVTGTFTNNLGFDLLQTIYLYNNSIYVLGPMKNGESKDISTCDVGFFNASYGEGFMENGENILYFIAGQPWEDSSENGINRRIYYAFDYFLSHLQEDTSEHGTILAVTEDTQLNFLNETGLNTNGIQVLNIQTTPPSMKHGKLISLDTAFSSVIQGVTNFQDNRWLYSEDQVQTYQIKHLQKLKALVYSAFGNMEFNDASADSYYPAFHGTISAYNITTGDYDQIFLSGTEGTLETLSDYIDKDGTLTLKFTPSSSDDNEIIPYLYLLYN